MVNPRPPGWEVFPAGDQSRAEARDPVRLEWLVTNGMGGFASATVGMTLSRRYHGLLVAAAGDDRTVLLSRLDDGFDSTAVLEFRLELGLPVWTLRRDSTLIERR